VDNLKDKKKSQGILLKTNKFYIFLKWYFLKVKREFFFFYVMNIKHKF